MFTYPSLALQSILLIPLRILQKHIVHTGTQNGTISEDVRDAK